MSLIAHVAPDCYGAFGFRHLRCIDALRAGEEDYWQDRQNAW